MFLKLEMSRRTRSALQRYNTRRTSGKRRPLMIFGLPVPLRCRDNDARRGRAPHPCSLRRYLATERSVETSHSGHFRTLLLQPPFDARKSGNTRQGGGPISVKICREWRRHSIIADDDDVVYLVESSLIYPRRKPLGLRASMGSIGRRNNLSQYF